MRTIPVAALAASLAVLACQAAEVLPGGPVTPIVPPPRSGALVLTPSTATIRTGTTQTFSAAIDGSAVAVRWSVKEAGGGSVNPSAGTGTSAVYTAPGAAGTYTVQAFDPVTVQTGQATVSVTSPGGGSNAGRFAALMAPVDGETFTGPTVDLRFVGVGYDPSTTRSALNADQLQLVVDGTPVLTVPAASSEFWVFKGFASAVALAPGDHVVVARATYSNPANTIESPPITIHVEAAPSYGQTVELSGDRTVAQLGALVGSAGSRIRVNGNGYRILDAGAASVNWQYVDFHDLGSRTDTSENGIDVTTSGSIGIQGCRFDFTNPTKLTMSGASAATIRGNTWRSNVRQPIGQGPTAAGGSHPAVKITGKSTAASVFAGNNVGAGWVELANTQHWTVGGDAPADANVLIGPRVGVFVDWQVGAQSSDIVIRRNYSHHLYRGGWSQGSNFELRGIASVTAEHNVILGSSWTVRGVGGALRYNLIGPGGEGWVWVDPGAFVHHNVFVRGGSDRAGIFNTYGHANIRILNNTFDGLGESYGGWLVIGTTGTETVSSNAFVRWPAMSTLISFSGGGALTAGRNLFYQSATPHYWDARTPAGDVEGDPLFGSPPSAEVTWSERAVWERTLSPSAILTDYRARYAPGAGSPAVDAGDPDPATFGAGNDIGAVGAGAANAFDLFGK